MRTIEVSHYEYTPKRIVEEIKEVGVERESTEGGLELLIST